MAPLTETWPASELPDRIQTQLQHGKAKRRKYPLDLKKCELMEMVQYTCTPPSEAERMKREKKSVVCRPVVRLFRKCAQGVTVETTAWEGERAWVGGPADNAEVARSA